MMIPKIRKNFNAVFSRHVDIKQQKIYLMSIYKLYTAVAISGSHGCMTCLLDYTCHQGSYSRIVINHKYCSFCFGFLHADRLRVTAI